MPDTLDRLPAAARSTLPGAAIIRRIRRMLLWALGMAVVYSIIGTASKGGCPGGFTGDGGYLHAFDEVVIPAVRAFHPDLVLVACGFDAGIMDPLARQMVTSQGFRALARRVLDVASECCGGRVAMSHEGGYNPVYVPFCGLAVLEEMAGVHTLDDPFQPVVAGMSVPM